MCLFSEIDENRRTESQVLFTTGLRIQIDDTKVEQCANEKELLEKWRDFVLTTDPDCIVGYNITAFDLPYLLARALENKISNFHLLGRDNDSEPDERGLGTFNLDYK